MNKPTRRKFLKSVAAGMTAMVPIRGPFARGASDPISLKFWDMRVGPAGVYGNAARTVVERYNSLNPKISVSYELEEWSEWPQLFSIALGADMAPDLSTGGAYQAAQFFERGQIVPLDEVLDDLKRTGEDKDFISGALDQMVYNGHTVALPYAMDLRVIFYRRDLFAKANVKAPATWDELRAAARTLTRDGCYGLVVGSIGGLGGQYMLLFMLNNDGGLFDRDGNPDVMNSRNVEAAEFLWNLGKDGSIHPNSLRLVGDDARKEFLEGRAAMIVDGPGLQAYLQEQRDKIGVLAPPIGPHGDKGTTAWFPNVMVYEQSKNPDSAKQFARWWVANHKALWTEGHCSHIPVRKSILADTYFQDDPILADIVQKWAPVGKGLGWHQPGVFPFLNTLDGYGPMEVLTRDLIAGKDPKVSLQLTETRLKALMANAAAEKR